MSIFALEIFDIIKISALVVQWIECGSPKAEIRVRFSSGVQNGKDLFPIPFFIYIFNTI